MGPRGNFNSMGISTFNSLNCEKGAESSCDVQIGLQEPTLSSTQARRKCLDAIAWFAYCQSALLELSGQHCHSALSIPAFALLMRLA